MKRPCYALLLAVGTVPLGGCVVGMATGAAEMAIKSAQGTPQNNEHLHGSAQQDCSAQAARYGQVKIIDIEQRGPSKIIVWGSVDDGQQRRSFECRYTTRIVGFKLRAIATRR